MAEATKGKLTLENVRQSLIRQEDTIVFSLIERAAFPSTLPPTTTSTRYTYIYSSHTHTQLVQAISSRIHYGYYVAEVKFRDAPQDYEPAIRSQDREGLMKLLTFTEVEELVKQRVEKKPIIFGQQISLDVDSDTSTQHGKYKVDPSLVSRLYGEWIMPLTKLVQVEYLFRRLD